MKATTVEKTGAGTITTTYTFLACDAFVYALIVLFAVQTVALVLSCLRAARNARPTPPNREQP